MTGAEGLARHTGLIAFEWLTVALYALLLTAWSVTACATTRGLLAGTLLPGPPGRPGG